MASVLAKKALRAHLKKGHPISFIAKGKSMLPLIPEGSSLFIEPVKIEYLHPGDILLLLNQKSSFITHRLLKKLYRQDGVFLFTKGDSLREFDPLFPASHFLGKISHLSLPSSSKRIQLHHPLYRFKGYLLARINRLSLKIKILQPLNSQFAKILFS